MPLPKPTKQETQQRFMKRCMAAISGEFPDNAQRAAVCYTQWRNRDKPSKAKASHMPAVHPPQEIPADIQLSGPMFYENLEAAADSESLPTFRMKANTGVPMKIRGFYDPIVIDMKGVKLAASRLPVVADHDLTGSGRVGHTTKIAVNEDSIDVEGVVSATGTTARELVADAKNGFPFQASLGAKVLDALYVDKKQSMKVNGREIKGPVVVARKVSIYEFTATSVGADTNTSLQISASANGQPQTIGVSTMNFEEFVASLGLNLEDCNEQQKKSLKAHFDAHQQAIQASESSDNNQSVEDIIAAARSQSPPPPAGVTHDDLRATLDAGLAQFREDSKKELERVNSINALCAAHSDVEGIGDIKAKALKENWSVDATELQILRASRPTVGPFIQSGRDAEGPPANAVIEASLLIGEGGVEASALEKQYGEQVINAAMDRRNRAYSLHRLCHDVLAAAGVHHPAGVYNNDFVRAVMRADRVIRAAGDFSTVTVSGILSNVMNKTMLQAFTHGDMTLQSISASRSVNDFKEVKSFRMTGIGEFQEIGAGGELKHLSLGEEEYANQVSTYGAMLVLTRNQIINDDLNAFLGIPRTIGRSAGMKLRDVGWSVFLDNAAFFTAGNRNLLTGNPYGIDGLTAANEAFRRMTDINGKPVDIIPNVQLGPVALEVPMWKIYNETRLISENQDGSETVVGVDVNPHARKWTPHNTVWLEPNYTSGGNGSLTDWYLLSTDPDTAVLELAYLNGQQTPIIEEIEPDPSVLGMGWRSYFDFGAALKEHRGGVKSTAS